MRIRFFDVIRTLHAWGGVTLALLLMVVSLSGAMLVWKADYLKWTMPSARVAFSPTPEALALIGEAIDRQFDPDYIQVVYFATAELPLTYISLVDERYAYLDVQGNIVAQWQGNGRAEEWLFDLHHRLLLDNLGLTIVGFASMAMVILLFAGVLAFWPSRAGWRHGIWPRGTGRKHLQATHRNLGITLALPFLLTLITGIVLAFPQATETFLLDDLRRTEEYSDKMVEQLDTISGAGTGDWLPALKRAQDVFPGAVIRSVQVPGGFSSQRVFGLQQAGELNRTGQSRVYIDADQGWMDLRIDALGFPLIERVYNMALPLHTAHTGFSWYKILLTLVGLGVLVISTLGLVSFIKQYTR